MKWTTDLSFRKGPINLQETVKNLETDAIRAALQAAGGNQSRAAELLSIKRTTMLDKMDRYGMIERHAHLDAAPAATASLEDL